MAGPEMFINTLGLTNMIDKGGSAIPCAVVEDVVRVVVEMKAG